MYGYIWVENIEEVDNKCVDTFVLKACVKMWRPSHMLYR